MAQPWTTVAWARGPRDRTTLPPQRCAGSAARDLWETARARATAAGHRAAPAAGSAGEGSTASLLGQTAAILAEADLEGADLAYANLLNATLKGATLARANLTWANLSNADLTGANLSHGTLFGTVFGNIDLTAVQGLETCRYVAPSTLDHRTLAKSGPLPLAFLRGCGLSDWEIEVTKLYDQHLTSGHVTDILYRIHHLRTDPLIQFFSCFISYKHTDVVFARRLHDCCHLTHKTAKIDA